MYSSLKNIIVSVREKTDRGEYKFVLEELEKNIQLLVNDKAWLGNNFFLQNIFKSFKNEGGLTNFLEFINQSEFKLNSNVNNYTISSYGWCLYKYLKEADDFLINSNKVIYSKSIDIFKLFEFPFHNMLFRKLLERIIYIEKQKKEPNIDMFLLILKNTSFLYNTPLKKELIQHENLIAQSLFLFRKANKTSLALKFLDSNVMNFKISVESDESLKNAFGWILYNNLKDEHEEKEVAISRIIESIHYYSTKREFSPFSKLFKLVLKQYKTDNNTDWESILYFLNKIDREELSNDSIKQVYGDKEVELASDLEDWYVHKVKACYHTEEYSEAIVLAEETLQKIKKLHYRNGQWLTRIIGLSYKELEDYSNAISYLKKFIRKNRDWYGRKDIASIYFELGKNRYALDYAIEAVVADKKDMEKKVNLYSLIAQILEELSIDLDIAYKHYKFATILRENSGWSVPEFIINGIERLSNDNTINVDVINKLTFKELKKDLITYWRSKKKPPKFKLKGVITRLNEHKQSGEISDLKNKKYFFYFSDFKSNIHLIKANTSVSFLPIKTNKKGLLPRAKNIKINKNEL